MAAAEAKFQEWDLDGNGVITRFELRTAMGARGVREATADEAFNAMGSKEDDGVDFEEFEVWFASAPPWAFLTLNLVAGCLGDDSACGVSLRGGAHVAHISATGPTQVAAVNVGVGGYLELFSQEPLAGEFTLCCWVRRPAGANVEFDHILLSDDGSRCLLLLDAAGHVGVAQNLTAPVFSEVPVVADEAWTFIVVEGSASQTNLCVATAARPAPDDVASAQFGLTGSRLKFVGRGPNQLQISEVKIFSRKLSLGEVYSVFADSAFHHGIAPGHPQLAAVPKCGIQGHVTCDGVPIEGVHVLGECASHAAMTDSTGHFGLELAGPATTVGTLTFRKLGFADCSIACVGGSDLGEVRIRKIEVQAHVRACDGITLTHPKTGSSATLLPDALCYLDGQPFAGVASVQLSVIDAADPVSLASMPGDFSAQMADGSTAHLQSMGAIYVGIQDEHANELACKPGFGMTLEIQTAPLTFDLTCAKSMPGVYSFDGATGKWVERPDILLEINDEKMQAQEADYGADAEEEGDNFIVWTKEKFEEVFRSRARLKMGGVERQGWWNCDAPYLACLVNGRFSNVDACAGGSVWSVGVDYQGRARSVVAADGSFAVMAQCRSQICLEVGLIAATGGVLHTYRQKLAEHQWLQGKGRLTKEEHGRRHELTLELQKIKPETKITLGPFTTSDPGETVDLGDVMLAIS